MLSYVVITAARNEAQFIELTLKCMAIQTIKPLKWVIVSDGSNDGTDEIVERYKANNDWIELLRLPERADRHFAGKVGAFKAGHVRVAELRYDIIANLDADVSFDEDYFAFLIGKLVAEPSLGLVGTPYFEENRIHDERFKNPDHVSGACQVFRRDCFEDIGGYQPVKSGGVDLIALLSAQAKGWKTKRFDERVCNHHRTVGSGMYTKLWRRQFNLGKKDYLLGSHPAFEVFRSINQMKSRPYVMGGVLILIGYFWTMLRRVEHTMPRDLIAFRRADQMQRLWDVLRHLFRQKGTRSPS